ncbi:hypothetical protein ACLBWZ_10550 [Brucellaceae bacterium C25G]
MTYVITSDQRDWTGRDIIVTIFADGTATPRNKEIYLSHKRTSVSEAIQIAKTWLALEGDLYDRIVIYLTTDAELPSFLK